MEKGIRMAFATSSSYIVNPSASSNEISDIGADRGLANVELQKI